MLKGFNVRNKRGLLDTALITQSNCNSYYALLSSKKDKQICFKANFRLQSNALRAKNEIFRLCVLHIVFFSILL